MASERGAVGNAETRTITGIDKPIRRLPRGLGLVLVLLLVDGESGNSIGAERPIIGPGKWGPNLQASRSRPPASSRTVAKSHASPQIAGAIKWINPERGPPQRVLVSHPAGRHQSRPGVVLVVGWLKSESRRLQVATATQE